MASAVIEFNLHEVASFRKHLSKLEPVSQTLEPDEVAPSPVPNLAALEVAEERFCATCDQVFETRPQQMEHFRGDWHRLNIKAKLKGCPAISELEFEQLGSDCDSISASDSGGDDDDDEVEQRVEILYDAAKLLFMNADGHVVEISRTLLRAKNELLTSAELLARVAALANLWLGLIIVSGGHFAAAIYRKGKMIRHKTFHQYTVRKRRGGCQSFFDSKVIPAKSAGASLRRYNEKILIEKSHAILKSWPELDQCSVVLFRALGFNNRSILFGGNDPVFRKDDIRLRTIPMVTRRPTRDELDRIHTVLTKIKVVRNPSSHYETRNVTIEKDKSDTRTKSKQDTSRAASGNVDTSDDDDDDDGFIARKSRKRDKVPPSAPAKDLVEEVFASCRDDDPESLEVIVSKIDKDLVAQAFISPLDDDGNTVVHFCCRRSRLAILDRMLTLGADPAVANRDGHTPYTVAANDSVRQRLIAFRQENPTAWDYVRAKIPDKLPESRKATGAKKAPAKRSSKNAKERDLSKKLTETMRSCDACRKEFRGVPLEADSKRFCSVNCVRVWRFQLRPIDD